MADYLDRLMDDHGLIEKALIIIEREADKGTKMNVRSVKSLIEILHDFGEQCHNMREEKAYFPLLLERGLPPKGPVSVMIQEHEQERAFIGDIKNKIEEFEDKGSLSGDFSDTVHQYSELRKNHIWKENDILFPMGKKILKPEDNDYLMKEFDKIEEESVGIGSFERYKIMVDMLEEQTGEKINLLKTVSPAVMEHVLDALPIEISFVDADDRVRYFNKLYEKKIFARTLSVIGRTVQQCHPQKSVHLVNKIIDEMKAGKREKAVFWIQMDGMFLHISYYAVRNDEGTYEGCVEMVHDVQPYRELEGEKRLLDE